MTMACNEPEGYRKLKKCKINAFDINKHPYTHK